MHSKYKQPKSSVVNNLLAKRSSDIQKVHPSLNPIERNNVGEFSNISKEFKNT